MIERTSGFEVWYGAGALWNSISIPTARLIRPVSVSAPCEVTCASITSSATPSRISPRPAHEIGSTEKPKSAVRSEMPPSAPGQHDAGMEDLEADARDAGEEEQARGGSGR